MIDVERAFDKEPADTTATAMVYVNDHALDWFNDCSQLTCHPLPLKISCFPRGLPVPLASSLVYERPMPFPILPAHDDVAVATPR